MDKEFAKKVRAKKLRTLLIVLVLAVAAVIIACSLKIERADYAKPLKEEIQAAESLINEKKGNAGNRKGQYAPYTILDFQNEIDKAKEVSTDKDSSYTQQQETFKNLKAARKEFEKKGNSSVLSAGEVENYAEQKETIVRTEEIKSGKEITYRIEPEQIKQVVDINFMAGEEGPYFERLSEILAYLKVQGSMISLYQDGSYGAAITVSMPVNDEVAGHKKGYLYRFDERENILAWEGQAVYSDGKVSFEVEEGGDYVVIAGAEKGITAGGDISLEDIEADIARNEKEKAKAQDITVSLEIRCDELSKDMSKLKDEALKEYVPEDGCIFKDAQLSAKRGDSIFDVLDRACRDQEIQIEYSYTPGYSSYYIEGINYLYEFDAGNLSGWSYTVNGQSPDKGCSQYELEGGEKIVWEYTCGLWK